MPSEQGMGVVRRLDGLGDAPSEGHLELNERLEVDVVEPRAALIAKRGGKGGVCVS